MPICTQLTPLLFFRSPTHYFPRKIWPKTLAKIEHRTVLFHGFYGPRNCVVLRKIKFSYFYRGLLNGCDGNHVRFCHHDGHRAQLLLSRTYPHACARLGPNVSYNKNTPLYFNFLKFTIFRHILGKKTPRVPGAKFQKQQNKSHRSFSNNQSFRNNKSGSSSQGRRASTSVQFGGNTNMEETWTSISHRWPTWQLFRSALSLFLHLL